MTISLIVLLILDKYRCVIIGGLSSMIDCVHTALTVTMKIGANSQKNTDIEIQYHRKVTLLADNTVHSGFQLKIQYNSILIA